MKLTLKRMKLLKYENCTNKLLIFHRYVFVTIFTNKLSFIILIFFNLKKSKLKEICENRQMRTDCSQIDEKRHCENHNLL